jgi:exodeoxyribonuclease VII small subunit
MTDKQQPAEELDEISFEDALAQLEETVHQLEEGELGLGDSLERYQQCVALLKRCHQQLEQATRQVELLRDVDDQGEAVTAPFEDEDLSLDEKQESRARRRGAAVEDTSSEDGSNEESEADDVDDEPGLF